MSDIAIRVENLGKQYRIGAKQERYNRFTETVMDTLTAPVRRLASVVRRPSSDVHGPSSFPDLIWALNDVSFEVQRGEVVGIIGRNGAGKSTLLKILSRITEPTTGRVELHGRVSSLLEVGTGFHPELTGRENVYLNGAILGMRREEIEKKFDEIVTFSGVEQFLDTPVKRYSSGMQVRLAFAVAAHLEPEILLIDEVLAVGDAAFQQKCLGKMSEVAGQGRTVLFVSHNMGAVDGLCARGIWLEAGGLAFDGPARDAIERYLAGHGQEPVEPLRDRSDRSGSGEAKFVGIALAHDGASGRNAELFTGQAFEIHAEIESSTTMRAFVALRVRDHAGRPVAAFNSREGGYQALLTPGHNRITLRIPFLTLLEGDYWIDGGLVKVDNAMACDRIARILHFRVHPQDFLETGAPWRAYHGLVLVPHTWVTREGKSINVGPASYPTGPSRKGCST